MAALMLWSPYLGNKNGSYYHLRHLHPSYLSPCSLWNRSILFYSSISSRFLLLHHYTPFTTSELNPTLHRNEYDNRKLRSYTVIYIYTHTEFICFQVSSLPLSLPLYTFSFLVFGRFFLCLYLSACLSACFPLFFFFRLILLLFSDPTHGSHSNEIVITHRFNKNIFSSLTSVGITCCVLLLVYIPFLEAQTYLFIASKRIWCWLRFAVFLFVISYLILEFAR